jgi:hypothetical protein
MKVSCRDKLFRAAFAAAAAATLWVSSSTAAAAAAPEAPDRDGDGDDGLLGEGVIDSAGATVEQADPAAVGDYLESLLAVWEGAGGQAPSSAPEGLTAQDCAELPLPGADEADPAVEADGSELLADSVDADVIVGDAITTDAQDLAAEWSLDGAGESFTFDDAAATNEDTTAPTEPEAIPTEPEPAPAPIDAVPAGPDALAASAWFQTVLERYHGRPIGASSVRPIFCGLAEPNGSLGF